MRTDPEERELADLAALADGSLPEERRAAVEARVARSPELQAELARQRAAIDAIVAADVQAPAGLRERVESDRARLAPRARRRRGLLAGACAAAAAAVALVAVLTLPAGTPGAPTAVEAAALALKAPTAPAPGPKPGAPTLLRQRIDSVTFPNWGGRLRWPASGARVDEIGGRRAVTVFYDRGAKRIGYTILDGPAVSVPAGARRAPYEGVDLRLFTAHGATAVTWVRHGHTCVLAGRDVSVRALQFLAAWSGAGAVEQ
jgi:hypothetical protein